MTHFFGARNEHGSFDQYFAVADDGRAVQFSYDRPIWLPITPSKKMGERVLNDRTLERLSDTQAKDLFKFTDPPRNFSVEWCAEQRWGGWVVIGLFLLPGILLWFIWEQLHGWSRGFAVMSASLVFPLQFGLIALFREPLTTAIVRFAAKIDRRRKQTSQIQNPQAISEYRINSPAQAALLNSLPPKERFKELSKMAAELARMDAEHNLREREKLHQTTDAAKQMAAQKHTTTSDGMTQKQFAEQKASTPSEAVNSILRRVDQRDTVPTKVGREIAARVLKKRAQAHATRTMEVGEKDRAQETKDNFQVFVDDNFNYMDEDERYRQGEYASEADAIQACQKIVNEFLLHACKPDMTSQELFEMYVGFGEYPWIQGGDFSAWNYAKLRSEEILKPNNET